MPRRVAVVIVSFNSADVLAECLGALSRASEGVEVVSVVLADNASEDGSIAVATEAWPGLTVVRTGGNLGYAAALNRGRAACRPHDALLVLNPDTVLEAGALSVLARTAAQPGCGIAVPRMVHPDGSLALSLRRHSSLRSAWAEAVLGGPRAGRMGLGEVVSDAGCYQAERAVDWATGAAVMIDQRLWTIVGDWDESFFLYSEETEYMMRAWTAGFRVVYAPQAVCRHRGGESSTSPFLWSLLMVNKVRLYRRSHGRMSSAAFRLALLIGQGGRALAGSKRAAAAVRRLLRPIEAA
jgi:GT2 family glycosyltransferase